MEWRQGTDAVNVTEMPKKFALTMDERLSPQTRRMVEACEARLEKLRKSNEVSWSKDDTEKIRGRIAEMRLILGWLTPSP